MKVLINIDVPELEPAIEFYTAALGLTHSRTLDGDVAELTSSSSIIYLLKNEAGSQCASTLADVRDYARHWTPVHVDFVVEDITTATQRVVEAGARQETGCVEWKGSKCITFSDPFGHGFCLIEFEENSYR